MALFHRLLPACQPRLVSFLTIESLKAEKKEAILAIANGPKSNNLQIKDGGL